MHFEQTSIFSHIDPYLQRIMEWRERGLSKPMVASTAADEIAVIARVSDLAAWQSLPEVRNGAVLGKCAQGTSIVTARISHRDIETVRRSPTVLSLKPARKLRPLLSATLADTRCRADLLPAGQLGDLGRECVVGIVDFGCDFAHDNVRHADGSTRIEAIWDQNADSDENSPFGYGKVFESDGIDAALQDGDPYTALGYGPAPDTIFSKGTHGTHVMDIAAGNGRGSGTPGTAPNASIVFVQIAASDIPWSGPQTVGSHFGDSVQLLEAVKFIFDRAGDRPCVVNLSLGTNGGPHDGTTLVEQGLDALISQQPDRAVVIAASNAYDDGIHAAGSVPAGGSADVLWDIPTADVSGNELEIWYDGEDRFQAELITPDGDSLGSVALGENGRLQDDQGRTILFVSHRAGDPNNGDHVVNLFLESGLPAGQWVVRLHGEQVQHGGFHAWIERDDAAQSSFPEPRDNSHTLGSVSTGYKTVVVGSYDAHQNDNPLSWFSSAGPTRDGRQKPEISAPGHDVIAAHSRTGTGVVAKSGTSMAAPAVAGIIALVLSEARARQQTMEIETLRRLLLDTARAVGETGQWHGRYGFGGIDAAALVQAIVDADQ